MNNIREFLRNIVIGNNIEAKENFNDMVSQLAMSRLAERKQEIAQNLFQTEEKIEETESVELDERAKWRSTSVAQKVTDPESDNPVSMSYHHERPGSTGMLRATSDTDEKESSLSARRRAQIATQGPRKGMITKRSADSLKNKIKTRLRGEEVELDEANELEFYEAKAGKIDLTYAFQQHGRNWSNSDYYTNAGARKGVSPKKYNNAMKKLHARVAADHGEEVANDMHKHSQAMANRWYGNKQSPQNEKTAAAIRKKHGIKWDGNLDLVESVELDEKAVSQQQQKFMGMVYAAKKGMKPASPEVAKAAAGMTKKQAKDYAATKHEGLPKKVNQEGALTTAALAGLGGIAAGPIGAAIGAGLGHKAAQKP